MAGRDALRTYLDQLLATLDEPVDGAEMARRSHLSRFHLGRLLQALTLEPPVSLRRRILLERAAYHLGRSGRSITRFAIDAGYDTPSSFGRAFRWAYGHSPAAFRGLRNLAFYAPAPNGIHYHPPADLYLPGFKGEEIPWISSTACCATTCG